MILRVTVLILTLIMICTAAFAAQRTMVGFVPLNGGPGTYAHVVAELCSWTMSRAMNAGIVDTGSMIDCVQLDRLEIPADLNAVAGSSRLAGDTGVNYLIRGVVDQSDDSQVRFKLHIYSAADERFHKRRSFQSRLTDLPAIADEAANWISAELGITLSAPTERCGKVSTRAMQLMDEALRLSIGCEVDQAEINKSFLKAAEARNLSGSNDVISRWMRSVPYTRQRGMGRLVWSGRRHSVDASEPAAPIYTIAKDGTLKWRLSDDAWRRDLENIRDIRGDSEKLISYFRALSARHSNSAYMRYCSSRAFSIAGEPRTAADEIVQALRINPGSFRLQMRLISTLIDAGDIEAASRRIRPALKKWPDRSECHLAAASIYRSKKQYEKAAEHMKVVAKLDPGYYNKQHLISDYLSAGKIVDSMRAAANTDDRIKRGIIVFSAVLTGVFVAGVLGISLLVKIILRA